MLQSFKEKIICYSFFSPEFDKCQSKDSVLSEIRKDFFEKGKKQKNKVAQEINNELYRYSYSLEQGKPLKWKKVLGDVVLEKSRISSEDGYEIVTFDENKNIEKIIYFSNDHSLKKVEYLNNSLKNRVHVTVSCENINNFLTLTEHEEHGRIISTRLYPFFENNENKDEFIEKNSTFICDTNVGRLVFCTNEQIQFIKSTKIRGEMMQYKNKHQEDEKINVIKEDSQDNSKCLKQSNNSSECVALLAGCPYVEKFKKVIKTDQNDKYFYFGEIDGIFRNGFGKTVTQNGKTLYEGYYKNDKRDGFGTYYYSSGGIFYVGNWKDNKKDKLGISFSKDLKNITVSSYKEGVQSDLNAIFDNDGNFLFAGKLKNQQMHGAGLSFNHESKKMFVSKFQNGKRTNLGTTFDDEGNLLYSGEINEGIASGFGTEYNIDGTIKYRGFFLNGKYHGKGSLCLTEGRRIEGSFEHGILGGVAVEYNNKNEKVYEGNWKDNLYNGEGMLCLKDGSYLKGTFKDGEANGVLSKFNSSKELIYTGDFNNDSYEGVGKLYAGKKKVYEGEFKNNLYNGKGMLYEGETCVYKGEFKDGVKCGLGQSFKDGKLEYVGLFKDDKYDGLGVLYENGCVKFVGNFSFNQKNGRVNEIYQGCVVKECIFENDNLKYAREYEYPEMNLVYDGNFKDGLKNGMGCQFNLYAEKEQEGIFENDTLINSMKVCLKKLLPLEFCEELKDTDYEKLRFGTNFVIEEPINSGIYSGKLVDGKMEGNGSILYSDHKYRGKFLNGQPSGYGIIYKNDGTKIKAKFINYHSNESKKLIFADGVEYNFIQE